MYLVSPAEINIAKQSGCLETATAKYKPIVAFRMLIRTAELCLFFTFLFFNRSSFMNCFY